MNAEEKEFFEGNEYIVEIDLEHFIEKLNEHIFFKILDYSRTERYEPFSVEGAFVLAIHDREIIGKEHTYMFYNIEKGHEAILRKIKGE